MANSPAALRPASPLARTRGDHRRRRRRGGAAARTLPDVEVIDLEDDAPPAFPTAGSARKARRKRGRPATLKEEEEDVVEIVVPPAAAAAAARRPPSPAGSPAQVATVRAIFPLVSRARVRKLLAMARAYDGDDAGVVRAVTAALAEDPRGANVSEATFAAAAVSGGGKLSPPATGRKRTRARAKTARLECQCCFAEHDFEDMVGCRGGHVFCKTCLQKHTEQRVFGAGNLGVVRPATGGRGSAGATASRALEIQCMAPDCAAGFADSQLRRVCPDKVLTKYDELQFAAAVESAGLEGVAKCPRCGFIAIPDEAWPALLFHCPRCAFKSCRECGEEFHPDLRCSQVETQDETNGRRTVEEAMTDALVRTCPRPLCRRKFLKNDGCNKMTCSCGCIICYVCGEEIPKSVGYKHFCQM